MSLRRAVVGSLGPGIGGMAPSCLLLTSVICAKPLSRYIPTKSDLINSAPGTPAANAMSPLNWGSADSGPWVVAPKVCDAKEGGFIPC